MSEAEREYLVKMFECETAGSGEKRADWRKGTQRWINKHAAEGYELFNITCTSLDDCGFVVHTVTMKKMCGNYPGMVR